MTEGEVERDKNAYVKTQVEKLGLEIAARIVADKYDIASHPKGVNKTDIIYAARYGFEAAEVLLEEMYFLAYHSDNKIHSDSYKPNMSGVEFLAKVTNRQITRAIK